VKLYCCVQSPDQIDFQSSKEELGDGRVADFGRAREVIGELRSAVADSLADVHSWGGEIPFEQASYSIEFLRV
jgi:hypothetical protein